MDGMILISNKSVLKYCFVDNGFNLIQIQFFNIQYFVHRACLLFVSYSPFFKSDNFPQQEHFSFSIQTIKQYSNNLKSNNNNIKRQKTNKNTLKQNKMEEQLQKQIKKNKNLLQSNFSLMQENQTLANALTKLKHAICPHLADPEETVHADDADDLVADLVMEYQRVCEQVKGCLNSNTKTVKNSQEYLKQEVGLGPGDAEKWKELYKNESEETLKLSQKLTECQARMRKMEVSMEADHKQMQQILNNYLQIFKTMHSYSYMINPQQQVKKLTTTTTLLTPINFHTGKSNHLHPNSSQRSSNLNTNNHHPSRSKSKQNKTATAHSNAKKNNINQEQQHKNPSSSLSGNNEEQILQMFPNFKSYLQKIQKQISALTEQIKLTREDCIEKESAIRMYRLRERQRLLKYGSNNSNK